VVDLFPDLEYEFNEDFSLATPEYKPLQAKKRNQLKALFKFILEKLHVLAICDRDSDILKVRAWTISIRGHYSYRSISDDFFMLLSQRISASGTIDVQNLRPSCGIHYRLGDLLKLKEKSPIPLSSILSEYQRVQRVLDFNQINIFSDSPEEAKIRFREAGIQNANAYDLSTCAVIAACLQSNYFIGTSSKVSFWIASLRAHIHGLESSLPSRNLREVENLLGEKLPLVSIY
jgi:hypothetical protein